MADGGRARDLSKAEYESSNVRRMVSRAGRRSVKPTVVLSIYLLNIRSSKVLTSRWVLGIELSSS